jgi:hypothetical protein
MFEITFVKYFEILLDLIEMGRGGKRKDAGKKKGVKGNQMDNFIKFLEETNTNFPFQLSNFKSFNTKKEENNNNLIINIKNEKLLIKSNIYGNNKNNNNLEVFIKKDIIETLPENILIINFNFNLYMFGYEKYFTIINLKNLIKDSLNINIDLQIIKDYDNKEVNNNEKINFQYYFLHEKMDIIKFINYEGEFDNIYKKMFDDLKNQLIKKPISGTDLCKLDYICSISKYIKSTYFEKIHLFEKNLDLFSGF